MALTDTDGTSKDPNRDRRCAHYKCLDCPTEFAVTLVGDRKLRRWCGCRSAKATERQASRSRSGSARACWRSLPFLAGLRCDRITRLRVDGPINGTNFHAYMEQFLLPTLSRGDVVIVDNLGSHKGQTVRCLIRAAGAKLFLRVSRFQLLKRPYGARSL